MWKPALFLMVSLAFCGAAAAGEPVAVRWAGVDLWYDPDHWQVSRVADGNARRFTCIAAECRDQPTVGAVAHAIDPDHGCAVPKSTWRREPVDWPDAAPEPDGLAFRLTSWWSGCRARDLPRFEACAEHDGMVYRLATGALGRGRHFGPEVPAHLFAELTRRVVPVPPTRR